MLDIILLRIMKYKKDYLALTGSVPRAALDKKMEILLDSFGKYFKKFPEHEEVDMKVFIPRFKAWYPNMTEEQFNTYIAILKNIREDVDESTRAGILNDLYEVDLATKMANICNQFDLGELKHPISELLTSHLDAYKINIGAKAVSWNEQSIEELLNEDTDNSGIKWRLNAINECMRPLRPGDFGIIAGRPDKGKTSLLSSEMTFMASQLPDDKNIVWLNNESVSGRIKKRLYQSALGKSITELVAMQKKGVNLRKMYEKVVGREDRIRVIDIHDMHVGQVEAILERTDPGIIVFDMIDNIKGFQGESRTDLQLEEMYKWARDRAVKYSCVAIATSQISVEGDGLRHPTLSMLKDSKTGKQGACDFQLMIGAGNGEGDEYRRYINLPKNKLRRDGSPSDPKAEVVFNPSIAIYSDVDIEQSLIETEEKLSDDSDTE